MSGPVPPHIAFLLGLVEGITEYLPISSTGHLILAAKLLGRHAGSFEIVIQLGAILAVLVQYRRLLATHARGVLQRRPQSLALFAALGIGFVPIAILGKLAGHAIKEKLFGPLPVAIALLAGGVLMIVVERVRTSKGALGVSGLDQVTPMRAFYIGIGQCFALLPGASRSMCTIVAGQLTGLSTATAAEFSFLLGLPTLGAATLYEGYKSRHELLHDAGALALVIGLLTSFFVAWAVIAAFLRYLQRRGLEPFGFYRILLGGLVLWLSFR